MTDIDIKLIVEACTEITNLVQIDLGKHRMQQLGCNNIGNIGAKAIAELLDKNLDVNYLSLCTALFKL